MMLLLMFSMAGVPPTRRVLRQVFVLTPCSASDMSGSPSSRVAFAIVGVFYYLRVVKVMYFDAPVDESPRRPPPTPSGSCP